MLKKAFFLIITLLVAGFSVVSAQSAADIQAMEQLARDFQAGKITLPEFQRQMEELTTRAGQQQYQQDQQQLQQQRQQQQSQQQSGEIIRRTFSGATAGWPPASAFRRYGKTVNQPDVKILANPYIQPPHSLTFSYRTQGEKLTIYIFRNFIVGDASQARADMNNNSMDLEALRNYFDNAFGGNLSWEDPGKTNVVPTPTNRGPFPYYTITVDFNEYNSNTIVGGLAGIHETYLVVEIEPKQSTRAFLVEH